MKRFSMAFTAQRKKEKKWGPEEKAFAREWVIITLQKKGDTAITDVRMTRKSLCDDVLRALI